MYASDCFLCRKHEGLEPQPPGGYILQDVNWLICHAPPQKGPLGTLFVKSRRHMLDHADFNDREMATFAPTLRLIYGALRLRPRPERVYLLSMMEGIPHFHAWIVPRMPQAVDRGIAFLAKDLYCREAEAADLVSDLRSTVNSEWSAS